MNRVQRYVASAAIAGVTLAGGLAGYSLVRGTGLSAAEPTTIERHPAVESISSAFKEIGKNVEPAVVSIEVRKEIKMPPGMRRQLQSPFNDPRFRRFFDPNGDEEGDSPMAPDGGDDSIGEQVGAGSGFIIEVDGKTGYIVTNNHVAGNASELVITLNDGRTIKNGKVIGADPKTDLAVIKIEADDLKSLKWGDSSTLQKGDWVLAFGSPFGYVGSMTHGIVSALHRTNIGIIRQGYENFIQVDAPINPGNSGGPLVSTGGEVIGINTAIASHTGGFQGIGFAIPAETARPIIDSLKTKGKVTRGWLGVSIASVKDPEVKKLAESFGYKGDSGVFVQQVFARNPAYGKLKRGDIITKLDGKEMADSNALRSRIASLSPGAEVTMTVFRDGKDREEKIKLGDQPEDLMAVGQPGGAKEKGEAGASAETLGMRLTSPSADTLQRLGLPDDAKGALVTGVAPRSLAAKAGIHSGDLITEVDGKAVTDDDEASTAIGKGDLKKGIRLYVVNRLTERFVLLQSDEPKGK